MIISIINHSHGKVSDAELQCVIRAINRQINEDFKPYWSLGATLRLEGRSLERPGAHLVDMRGDAVIYIVDQLKRDGTKGVHDKNYKGIPYGFVYLDIASELSEPWSVPLSHEALELIGDAEVNLLVAGPHPDPGKKRDVFHWYEMCDAVQAESYEIDGVRVSNFILPLYFTGSDEYQGRNDFLGTITKGKKTLRSFGVNPGGYIGFFDPRTGKHHTYYSPDDLESEKRMKIKSQMKGTRRAIRYQRKKKK